MSEYRRFAKVGIRVHASDGISCPLNDWEPADTGSVVTDANFAVRSLGRIHTVTASSSPGGGI